MISKKLLTILLSSVFVLSSSSVLYASAVDVTQLPLGDGKVSTSPRAGYVYACQIQSGGGGAQTVGSWIHGTTWNLKEKLQVQGAVHWPNAQFTISSPTDTGRTITGNGLPIDSVTGTFPVASTDPAYLVDRNPNTITTQSIAYTLPSSPTVAQTPSCVPGGAIGIALNGVAIFNALDGENRDAVANEVQDICSGHPERQGLYHYHGPSTCLPHQNDNSALVGYALDGFGIYSNHDAQGNEIATKDLDECHGTTSDVIWDGKKVSMYHYVITQDYPYTIGCFKGTPVVGAKVGKQPGTQLVQYVAGTSGSQPTQVQTNVQDESIISTSNLSLGSSGSDVVTLQTTLEQGGYLVIPKGIKKGYFGNATKDALKKFQSAKGLPSTGIFGPKTRTLYNATRQGQGKTVKPVQQVGLSATSQSTIVASTPQGGQQQQMQGQNKQPPSGLTQKGQQPDKQLGMSQSSSGTKPVPPAEAIDACDLKQEEGDACTFVAPGNKTINGTCRDVQELFVCVPNQ